jgi:catechol 2,3-dioxygenase-like lactoylglutathione lyase family enzyme
MSLLAGINHAALVTNDLDGLVAFYTEVFGVEVIFQESSPALRHAMLQVGVGAVLHPVELRDHAHARGIPETFQRGHLDHLGLNVTSRTAFLEARSRLIARGATDGTISDLGPQWSLWFTDPDGMKAELIWIHDPALRGFHGPTPLQLEQLGV